MSRLVQAPSEQMSSKQMSSEQTAFVLVFIGPMRSYMRDCLMQIRLWNKQTPIYLCVTDSVENRAIIDGYAEFLPTIVFLDQLTETESHARFHQTFTELSFNGFWKYTMERFFYVEECMTAFGLQNVFHLEFDNLIYFNADELSSVCVKDRVQIPSDNDDRFIAGICFVPTAAMLTPINQYFAMHARNRNEMIVLMDCYRTDPNLLEGLPVIMPEYAHTLKPIDGVLVASPSRLSATTARYGGLFDAAAIGQYIGGVDTIHIAGNSDGFVTPHSAFQVDKLQYQWRRHHELWRLYASADLESEWYPLYNLHIHNKNLYRWLSTSAMTEHLKNVTVEV